METPPKELLVAICTFRRPEGLKRLLAAVVPQVRDGGHARLLVVDSDPEGSARAVTADFDTSEIQLAYVVCQERGLAIARNRALASASSASAVIFVDDDEVPDPGWLDAFAAAHSRWPKAVIGGPITPQFSAPLPHWGGNGLFWTRPTYHNDTLVNSVVADGNLLLPEHAFKTEALSYDLQFNTIGAQDAELLLRWRSRGGETRWAAHATVAEHIPRSRMTLAYLMKRETWSAAGYALAELRNEVRLWKILRRIPFRFFRGLGLVCAAAIRLDSAGIVRGTLDVACAWGTVVGLRGRARDRYTEFQQDRGSAT